MIDLKHEIERELNLIDPPDLWDRIQTEASSNGEEVILDLTPARHRRRPRLWLAAAAGAACLAAIALATVVMSDRESVDTTDPSAPATPTTVDGDEQALMLINRMRFIDGPLAGGTLHLDVQGEANDSATGTLRFDQIRDGMVITVDCVDTDTETAAARFIVFGGEVTAPPDDGTSDVGDRLFLIVRRDPAYNVMIAGGDTAGSCSDFLESVPRDLLTDEGSWSAVGDGFGTDGPRTLATAEDVEITGYGGLNGQRLSIDAVEQPDGEVTGEFRVNNVRVTLQCADTETDGRDLILGGQVLEDPTGLGLPVADGNVAVPGLIALVIRDDDAGHFRVALYADDSAGSCTELVESVPFNLDGGFFAEVEDGLETD